MTELSFLNFVRNGCSGNGRGGAVDEPGLAVAGADSTEAVADLGEPALAVPVPDDGLEAVLVDAFAEPDVDVVEVDVGFGALAPPFDAVLGAV